MAAGMPTPNISWQLNGAAINLSSAGVVLHENGSLTISEANLDHIGFFTCVADNGVGIVQSTVQVDILVLVENITGM